MYVYQDSTGQTTEGALFIYLFIFGGGYPRNNCPGGTIKSIVQGINMCLQGFVTNCSSVGGGGGGGLKKHQIE